MNRLMLKVKFESKLKETELKILKDDKRVNNWMNLNKTEHFNTVSNKETSFTQKITKIQENKNEESLKNIQFLNAVENKLQYVENNVLNSRLKYVEECMCRNKGKQEKVNKYRETTESSLKEKRFDTLVKKNHRITMSRKALQNKCDTIKTQIEEKIKADEKINQSNKQLNSNKYNDWLAREALNLEIKQIKCDEMRKELFTQQLPYRNELNTLHSQEVRGNFKKLKNIQQFNRKLLTERLAKVDILSKAKQVADNDYQCEKRRMSTLYQMDKEAIVDTGIALKRAQSHSARVKLIKRISNNREWKHYICTSVPSPSKAKRKISTAYTDRVK